jgi:hypothetical protein
MAPVTLLLCLAAMPGICQLILSVPAKTYQKNDIVPFSIAVIDSHALPGAYRISLGFDTASLKFLRTVVAETGPFLLAPEIALKGTEIVMAGFQGVAKASPNPYSVLARLEFITRVDNVAITQEKFPLNKQVVYNSDGQEMALVPKYITATALQPFVPGPAAGFPVFVRNGLLHFSVPHTGSFSVFVMDMQGKCLLRPLVGQTLLAGSHVLPIGHSLPGGSYVVNIKGPSMSIVRKTGVVK